MSTNNCNQDSRCAACPVRLLWDAGDRMQAAEVIGSALRDIDVDPHEGFSSLKSLTTINIHVDAQVRQVLRGSELSEQVRGIAVGAVALTLSGNCHVAGY